MDTRLLAGSCRAPSFPPRSELAAGNARSVLGVEPHAESAGFPNIQKVLWCGMQSNPSSPPICHVLTIIDGSTEETVDLEEIKAFEIASFSLQFDVPTESDPEMLDRYAVGPDDIAFLQEALGFKLDFDFRRFAYFIDAARMDA